MLISLRISRFRLSNLCLCVCVCVCENACRCAKLLQSCWLVVTCGLKPSRLLCHGILQARILEWAAVPSSRGSSQSGDQTCISCLLCWQADFFLPLVPTGKSIHIHLTALGSTVCPHIYMKISVNQVNKQSEYSGVTFMNIGAKIRNNNYM